MAGFLSGNFAHLKVYHPLENEDGDIVGPSDWATNGAAAFVTAGARFGNAIRCDANGESLTTNVDVAALDDSDTAKTIYHCFWESDSLAFIRNQGFITGPAFSAERSRLAFDPAGGGVMLVRWQRSTDLSPGTNAITARSISGLISVDTPFSLVGFIDGASISQGKIFIDGVDRTASVTESARTKPGVTTKRIVIGNSQTGLAPARVVDELSIIQSPSLTDARLVILAPLYHVTRGFGFRPEFIRVDVRDVSPGDTVTLTGTGFGADVNIKVGGVDALNIVRVDDSTVIFEVPVVPGPTVVDLDIINVAAGVTWTETAALSIENTIWIPNGGSTRIATFGDLIKYGTIRIGNPLPFGNPNLDITVWTTISRSPE